MKTIIGLSLFIFALAGCGGGSSKPLTTDQKATLKSTATSVNSTTKAPLLARASRSNRYAFSTSQPERDIKAEKMAEILKDQCDIHFSTDSSHDSTLPLSFSLSTKGDRCPVDLDLSLKTTVTQESVNGQIHFGYSVKSGNAEFQSLNDVTGFSLAGNFAGSRQGGSLGLSGKIISQAYGTIPVSISGNGNSSGQSVSLVFQYPKFTANLTAKTDEGKTEFDVNGEKVTQEEFMTYIPGMSPDGKPMLSPTGSSQSTAAPQPQMISVPMVP